ncbi:LysR family transcriptional regulator [Pseudovibrio sp. SPO723]|uniref:LysR family transcriptional regulator n=1 Tax=Nesiotobacter zosterae TaxID=392721 RepID=UPI0029C1BB4E|nr:LysR family transcriptional regulator [Pseudovibrio sp. SPO723]MDX5592936.1 LysR family transcriptional regulator [Pseudovibrio sp. SPO723]
MSTISEMEIFTQVVASGGMSAAARELGLSPAVVSKKLSKLEQRLGTRLLQRTTRQIALTEAGQGYYERVLEILASIDEAEAYVSRRSSAVQGLLRVSAPTSFGRMHIAPHLNQFLLNHPEVTLQLDLSDTFVDIVGEGYDVAIRIGHLEDSSLVARRLAPIHRILCAAPGYLERHGPVYSLEDLLENHVCLAATQQELWRLEGPEGDVTVHSRGPLRTNSSEVVREAVLAGVGVALRSTWDVGEELRQGKLVTILPVYRASRHIALQAVYPSRHFVPAKLRAFVEFLATLYSPRPYWDADLPEIGNSIN